MGAQKDMTMIETITDTTAVNRLQRAGGKMGMTLEKCCIHELSIVTNFVVGLFHNGRK